jgi:thiamine pyrophosphokinase|tara:strand:- start:908 stop:1537 length:630 start_codon:yes stop_codon:yes gene_type:complete
VSDRHALVITGGPSTTKTADLPTADLVVAVNGGAEHATLLGLVPDLVVGDLDSISVEALAVLAQSESAVEQHPTDKDETDLELALASVAALGVTSVTIVTTAAGRPDHALANLLIAASDRWAELDVNLLVDSSRAWVVRHQLEFSAPIGSVVSLISVGGPATGISTSGLRWPLSDESLGPDVGRGVSNEVSQPGVKVTVGGGTLLVIAP